ncbi:MAG: hypothetical protein KatS3mg085_321 [Candidatus Dojkabacteria bacterium]|nr:MAG: hypothetical protein KatS3mg085_321 [Candidatus Dojkabacteria bacterium]
MAAAPKSVPFGDGFTPSKFDPSSLQDTKRFVQQNKKQGNSNSNKWLAVLFEKFVKEYEDQLNNNK